MPVYSSSAVSRPDSERVGAVDRPGGHRGPRASREIEPVSVPTKRRWPRRIVAMPTLPGQHQQFITGNGDAVEAWQLDHRELPPMSRVSSMCCAPGRRRRSQRPHQCRWCCRPSSRVATSARRRCRGRWPWPEDAEPRGRLCSALPAASSSDSERGRMQPSPSRSQDRCPMCRRGCHR